jgi:integrase/recombinase XerD
MAQSPQKKLQHELNRIEKYGENGKLPCKTTDALIEWSSALNPEDDNFEYANEKGESQEFAVLTVQTYLREMRKFAERACSDLLDVPPAEFNSEIDAMESGENPHVKDEGLAKQTLMVTQSAAQTFYWYFDLAHPDEIKVYGKPSNSKHDETDLFTRDEVQALRDSVEGARNRAILEMLLNTGQRISAIQGLRIRDIDVDAGYFYLNTDRSGLKGADRRGRRRPLLGARRPMANWLEEHPLSPDSDAYVFIGNLDHHKTKPDEPLCQGTIRRMLGYTAEKAGVDKPVNPHNFRHYWTTIMKQEYGLNDEEIKMLLGHKRSGNGVNAIYNHSVESKLRENTEWKIGHQESGASKSLTPENCGSCGETLEPHWKLCPVCGTTYGP